MKQAWEDLKSFVTVSMIVLLFVIVIANLFGAVLSETILVLVTNLVTAVFTYYFSKNKTDANGNTENKEESNMIRRVIQIEEDKCNGCGACAKACHEGAIGMVNGKAKLMRDDYCDGLGDCLPACPMDAIHFIEREAEAYDEAAVLKNKEEKAKAERSRLRQWPVQIKLLPVHAPFYEGANLLIAADCTAYAYAKFHDEFLKDRVVLVGCPKLDSTDYAVKLAEIIRQNAVQSITVVRMEVPCCGGLEMAAKRALEESGKRLPWQVITVGTDGTIRE